MGAVINNYLHVLIWLLWRGVEMMVLLLSLSFQPHFLELSGNWFASSSFMLLLMMMPLRLRHLFRLVSLLYLLALLSPIPPVWILSNMVCNEEVKRNAPVSNRWLLLNYYLSPSSPRLILIWYVQPPCCNSPYAADTSKLQRITVKQSAYSTATIIWKERCAWLGQVMMVRRRDL